MLDCKRSRCLLFSLLPEKSPGLFGPRMKVHLIAFLELSREDLLAKIKAKASRCIAPVTGALWWGSGRRHHGRQLPSARGPSSREVLVSHAINYLRRGLVLVIACKVLPLCDRHSSNETHLYGAVIKQHGRSVNKNAGSCNVLDDQGPLQFSNQEGAPSQNQPARAAAGNIQSCEAPIDGLAEH